VGLDLPPRTPLIEGVPGLRVPENRDKRGYRGCGGRECAISRLIAIHGVILTRARVAGGWVRASPPPLLLTATAMCHRATLAWPWLHSQAGHDQGPSRGSHRVPPWHSFSIDWHPPRAVSLLRPLISQNVKLAALDLELSSATNFRPRQCARQMRNSFVGGVQNSLLRRLKWRAAIRAPSASYFSEAVGIETYDIRCEYSERPLANAAASANVRVKRRKAALADDMTRIRRLQQYRRRRSK
jgi:hypothetical protein